jgi:hypothetical protein
MTDERIPKREKRAMISTGNHKYIAYNEHLEYIRSPHRRRMRKEGRLDIKDSDTYEVRQHQTSINSFRTSTTSKPFIATLSVTESHGFSIAYRNNKYTRYPTQY